MAIDLPSASQELQTKNVDPSHPGFYLPAQELLAGNSRGYWVPESCRTDGKTCDSGDQCCGGYCARDAKLKKNVCGGKPPVHSAEYDKCTATADCCASSFGQPLVCIGGRCSAQLVQ